MNRTEKEGSLSQGILQLLTHNFWLKLLSLGFAIVIFLIVRADQVREFTRFGKVHIRTGSNVMIIGPRERSVELTIRLPNALFFRPPSETELEGFVDLTNERTGKLRFRLSRENFPALDKRYSVQLPDPWLEIDLDYEIQKKVRVNAVLQGSPASGLAVETVSIDPEQLIVKGAKREISRIENLSTVPIKIDGLSANFNTQATLNLGDNSSISIEGLPKNAVSVQVILAQKDVTKMIRGVVVEIPANLRAQVKPAAIDVEIAGMPAILRNIKPGDVRAFLDVSDLSVSDSARQVKIKIPPNTSLVKIVPESVNVQFSDR